ncbi:hypothetical protein CYY_009086 [Polysphondylium violaceum]|uniref:KxDL domain-containing protein n=1 Tax=Polysphondylium violaceum TaxID=133409 RepID=A0A8J4PKL7_9MYCE|nr:hypothetical protein CYY_009086 [Polysphondylium violaceum]
MSDQKKDSLSPIDNVEPQQQQQQPKIPSASDMVTNEIYNLSNKEDIDNMINIQSEVLKKQYETNYLLNHFNDYSAQKYSQLSSDFEKHTKMLKEMKKDLDYIFKKTRTLQGLLNEKFPTFVPLVNNFEEEEDQDD